jgi:hypothetical protein
MEYYALVSVTIVRILLFECYSHNSLSPFLVLFLLLDVYSLTYLTLKDKTSSVPLLDAPLFGICQGNNNLTGIGILLHKI